MSHQAQRHSMTSDADTTTGWKEGPSRALALGLGLGLIALGVASRLLPHPPNFTPAASIALYAGFLFAHRWAAALTVGAMMLISDLVIGFAEPVITLSVYAMLILPASLRPVLRRSAQTGRWRAWGIPGPPTLAAAAVGCSLAFYAVTNFAVWTVWYDPTLAGLTACYVNALPFLKWTLLGDLVWTGTLFASHALALRLVGARVRDAIAS